MDFPTKIWRGRRAIPARLWGPRRRRRSSPRAELAGLFGVGGGLLRLGGGGFFLGGGLPVLATGRGRERGARRVLARLPRQQHEETTSDNRRHHEHDDDEERPGRAAALSARRLRTAAGRRD